MFFGLFSYEMMQLCRQFENACNQAYMQGHIRGFMHLDNGQETIPALVADSIKQGDIKYSYYREHTHAIASGVDSGAVMAELFAKDTGTCRGTGGSMHIYDKDTHFQGGWALVSEQLPYAAGAARSILLDRHLDPEGMKGDDRISIVFIGEVPATPPPPRPAPPDTLVHLYLPTLATPACARALTRCFRIALSILRAALRTVAWPSASTRLPRRGCPSSSSSSTTAGRSTPSPRMSPRT